MKVDPAFVHVRTSMLADLASAHARQGQVEQACAAVSEALDSAAQVGLLPNLQRLIGARRELLAWNKLPVVRELDDRLRESVRKAG